MSAETGTRRRRRKGAHRAPRPRRGHLVAAGVAVVAAGAIAGAVVTRRPVPASAAASRAGRPSAAPGRRTAGSAAPATALAVVSTTPPGGSTDIAFAPALTVRLTAPLATGSPMPTLSPAVPGHWTESGATLEFQATGQLAPGTALALNVPGGPSGIAGAAGQRLAGDFRATFRVAQASTLRLQELLAELGYLPVSFAPGSGEPSRTLAGPRPSSAAALAAEATSPGAVGLAPLPGSFAWRFSSVPAQLAAEWQPGAWNVVTQGAVMAFEADHGLAWDGVAGPLVWAALQRAVAARAVTTRPYDYLIATVTEPETLYVWSDGRVVDQSPTNSGVPGATTALGTWPVYLRYTTTTMSGTNPDGTHYNDPGIPWVAYFNGGDAVHGFVRAGYGFPQSDGCLELPVANAASVFPLDPIGTLVTVTTGDLSPELGAAPPTYAGTVPAWLTSPPAHAAPAPTTTTPPAPTTTTTTTLAPTTTTSAPAPTATTLAPATTTSAPASTTTLAPATTTLAPPARAATGRRRPDAG